MLPYSKPQKNPFVQHNIAINNNNFASGIVGLRL
jgi:hypothetical protein